MTLVFYPNELARNTRVASHFIFALGPSVLGMGKVLRIIEISRTDVVLQKYLPRDIGINILGICTSNHPIIA